MEMNLRTKTTLSFLAVSLCSLLLVMSLVFSVARQIVRDAAIERMEVVVSMRATRVRNAIASYLDIVRSITGQTALYEVLSTYEAYDPVYRERTSQILSDIKKGYTGLSTVSILGPNGRVTSSTDPGQIDLDYRQSGFYARALKTEVLVSLFREEKDILVRLAGPVVVEGRVVGLVLLHLRADAITLLMSDPTGFGDTGESFLVTRDVEAGDVVYLTSLRFDADAALRRHEDPTQTRQVAVWASSREKGPADDLIDYRQQSVLAATRHIEGVEWNVVAKIDREEAAAPISRLRKAALALFVPVGVLVMLFATWVSRSVTRPITDLLRQVHRMSSGDLSVMETPPSTGEIGQLSKAFNQMSKKLSASHSQMEKSVQALATSNNDLEQFAYAASHDLQEPLRTISSYLSLLKKRYEGRLDKDADEFIGFAVDGAGRMRRLINDLLTYSRVSRFEKDVTHTDLNETFSEALAHLEERIKEAGAQVTSDSLPKVWARRSEMLQLFQNLISNAIKFRTEEKPSQIHVGVEPLTVSGKWTITVRDNGIGIAPEYHDRIFRMFERLHGASAKYSGSGIGLSLCQKIVTQHGGRIWVESEEGQGCTFRLTLPSEKPV
jgi:signal transduction histidine kinase